MLQIRADKYQLKVINKINEDNLQGNLSNHKQILLLNTWLYVLPKSTMPQKQQGSENTSNKW